MSREYGVAPDTISFSVAMAAMAKAKQWQKAEALMAEMLKVGAKPDARAQNALMEAYARGGQVDKASLHRRSAFEILFKFY